MIYLIWWSWPKTMSESKKSKFFALLNKQKQRKWVFSINFNHSSKTSVQYLHANHRLIPTVHSKDLPPSAIHHHQESFLSILFLQSLETFWKNWKDRSIGDYLDSSKSTLNDSSLRTEELEISIQEWCFLNHGVIIQVKIYDVIDNCILTCCNKKLCSELETAKLLNFNFVENTWKKEKNDIIERLTSELDKAGKQIDQMGRKLNNNMMDVSFEQVPHIFQFFSVQNFFSFKFV